MGDNLPLLQEMINQADVIHFKDDEPLSRDWNGLKIPHNKPIVHTAGGSSFRGHEFTLDKSEHMGTEEIIFNKTPLMGGMRNIQLSSTVTCFLSLASR